MDIRIGHGYDVHRFEEGRRLVIGGKEIEYKCGLAGHSDADVLVHALMDAMLGALSLGDIGTHFPDTSEEYAGIDSCKLLARVSNLINAKGYTISNADCTVIAQQPKLKMHIPDMQAKLSGVLGIDSDRISIKATTEEKLGFTGRLEGISAHAVVLLLKI